jgi:hypothetical protein
MMCEMGDRRRTSKQGRHVLYVTLLSIIDVVVGSEDKPTRRTRMWWYAPVGMQIGLESQTTDPEEP